MQREWQCVEGQHEVGLRLAVLTALFVKHVLKCPRRYRGMSTTSRPTRVVRGQKFPARSFLVLDYLS
jgi:hypothetical protein